MTKVIDKAVVSVYPPENRNVLWLKETGSGVEPQVFKENSWKSAASSVNGGVLTPGTVFAVGDGKGNNIFEIISQGTLGFFLKDEYTHYLSTMQEYYDDMIDEYGAKYKVNILSPGELVSVEDDEFGYSWKEVQWDAITTVNGTDCEGVLYLTLTGDPGDYHYTLEFNGMYNYDDEMGEGEYITLRNSEFEWKYSFDPEEEGASELIPVFVEYKAGADKVEIKVAGKTIHLN